MNRRDLLRGLFGVVAASALPASALLEAPLTDDWEGLIRKVHERYMSDFMMYGTAALRYSNIFPYVENVDPSSIHLIPEYKRSLGEF